ncbi:MAG: N-6 DNA methylase [Parachlamydiaceae bacterium]|nr:N-6 DNA methylase [Parachlamydiaceae bacterium]
MSLFVSCGPGIETLLSDELAEIGFHETSIGFCGVHVRITPAEVTMDAVYAINYRSRLASRVLLPLHQFRCYDEKALYRSADKVDWTRFFRKGQTLAIDANVSHPRLRNSLFCAQVVKDAICDQLRNTMGSRPSVDLKSPDVQLNLFIHDDEAVISFDTSGDALHKRGYRQDAGEAPLQESMAAVLLKLAKYKGDEILIDPCCGSGTILIEAALIASNTAPGYLRKRWGFFNHPDFVNEQWLIVKNEIDSLRKDLLPKHFYGSEIDSEVARLCRANLRAAGFLDSVEVVRLDFADYTPSVQPHVLVTNPPHGRRLKDDLSALCALYRRLGDFMKQKLAKPGRGYVFVANPDLAKEVGLAPKRRHVLSNGGVESRLLEFDLY